MPGFFAAHGGIGCDAAFALSFVSGSAYADVNMRDFRRKSMKRVAPIPPRDLLHSLPILLAISHAAFAQDRDPQQLGMRLFNQSCRVCHTKPTLVSPQYGPVLSMNTRGGKADVMREVISNGTARMPGFKYDFTPAQIDAIVAYIKTIPAPAEAAPAKAGAPPGAD
jgi:mono/diheme cytochrome c family protein